MLITNFKNLTLSMLNARKIGLTLSMLNVGVKSSYIKQVLMYDILVLH